MSTPRKRITVPEVEKAYRITGLKPKKNTYVDNGEFCACPLGVLYMSQHPQAFASFKNNRDEFRGKDFDTLVDNWASRKYGKMYTGGFIEGVDYDYKPVPLNECEDEEEKEFTIGLMEGRDVVNKCRMGFD